MRHPTHNNTLIVLLLGSLCLVTPFAMDMYLPAFSNIAGDFHVATPEISQTLSTYLVGIALGQLIYGPLLDRFGRKRPLYAGLGIYIFCSIGCAMAPGLRTFVTLRFLEALGGCAAQVSAVAMVRDFFPVKETARVLSWLILMIGISPLLAPTIGSAMVASLGWRSIFGLLATIAAIIFLLILFLLPEGHQADHSVSLQVGAMLKGFLSILKDPQFLTYALAGAFSLAALFAFVAGSPIIFMDGFHLSTKAFGMVFALLVMGFIGGSQLNVWLLRKVTSQRIFRSALIAQAVMGVLLFVGARCHCIGLKGTLALFFLLLSCIGLTVPNAIALSLARFSRDAGRASALLGFLQNGTGALVSMGIGILGIPAIIPLLTSTGLVGLAILLIGRVAIAKTIAEGEAVVVH
jgi:DHA1 family bicyclomycin/chloramphenicol resistance-like MFS transporter